MAPASDQRSAGLDEQLDYYRRTMMDPSTAQVSKVKARRKFILCFDGTGNKFSGTDADSNILKIYRLLDRNEDDQFHYYQPGIGTYVVTTSKKDVSHTGRIERIKSWYTKAKDSAIGMKAILGLIRVLYMCTVKCLYSIRFLDLPSSLRFQLPTD